MSGNITPCPFCGETPTLHLPTCNLASSYDPGDSFPVVRCSCSANVSGRYGDRTGSSALIAWNRCSVEKYKYHNMLSYSKEENERLLRVLTCIKALAADMEGMQADGMSIHLMRAWSARIVHVIDISMKEAT
jgi:hypothetical protein